MFPNLLDVGFIHLRTYGTCMAIGFVLCWTIVERLSGRKDISNLLMALMIAGVAGSRVAYVIEHWRAEFAANPFEVVRIDRGGLMFYGGLIFAVMVFFGWCWVKREKMLELADLLALVLPLGHACGRIGCFFYGCCYGKISTSPLAVAFPRHSPAWFEQFQAGLIDATARQSLSVLPTQLFEAAALLALSALLALLYRRQIHHRGEFPAGWVTCAYLAGYAVIRFALECLRGDQRALVGFEAIGFLSISQAISVSIFLVAVVLAGFICYTKRK